MPEYLINYIQQYGYLILFCLVFLQEIGVPSFPNEIVLCYFGYLCSQNIFSLLIAFSIAVMADIIGTFLLYFLFYYFGNFFKKVKPSWLKKPSKKLIKIKLRMLQCDSKIIFLGRVTPFLRGYVSVFAGISQVPFKIYCKAVCLSALLWSGGWVIIGWATSPFWNKIILLLIEPVKLQIIVTTIISLILIFSFFRKKVFKFDKQ